MYLYKIVTNGNMVFYARSDVYDLSKFTKLAQKHYNTELRSVERLSTNLSEIN